jgi:triosephosphate isomerase
MKHPKPRLPLIIVNFKAAEHAVGDAALTLARICERVAREEQARVAIAVQPTDLHAVAAAVRGIPVLAQHVDPVGFGAHTGSMPAVVAKRAGAKGTLLNHSEHRLRLTVLARSIQAAHEAGLWVCACARDTVEARRVAKLKPDLVAVEPPKLIGGEVSVSTASPGVIQQSKRAVGRVPLLVGAGVKDGKDVRIALKLGAKGVLVASHVTNADNPAKVLRELIAGMKKAR